MRTHKTRFFRTLVLLQKYNSFNFRLLWGRKGPLQPLYNRKIVENLFANFKVLVLLRSQIESKFAEMVVLQT